jgi:hypothetical protein
MDEQGRRAARDRSGVVLKQDLGTHPGRAADRAGMVELHPGAWVAATQPVDVSVLLAAVREANPDRDWAVMSSAALWLYGVLAMPERLVIGVPLGHKLASRPPVKVRRVTASVLAGRRGINGCSAVALEIGVIQHAGSASVAEVRDLIEQVVRDRRTTLARLRARCRRGLKGSARVRMVCDELAGGSLDKEVRRLKKALEALGVVGLEAEVHFENAEGASAYADLLHWPTMTVIEVDGLLSHSVRERFRADRRRDRWMLREHAAATLRVDVMEIREDLSMLAGELSWFLLPQGEASASA